MKILDYYRQKQDDLEWVLEFQSTAQDKSGKIFNCINVNFRSLKAYFIQLDSFKPRDGLKRSEWNNYQDNGQEKDKHRIVALKNSGFIKEVEDRFFITEKGKCALAINDNQNLTDKEKWLLMYMLLLDFKFNGNEIDLVKSTLELSASLEQFGINGTKLISYLKGAMNLTEKKTFFRKDIFWLMSFYKDPVFIDLFTKSTDADKASLFDWVIMCSNNKASKDCIAHKFVSGGAYTGSMFNEDVNILLCTLVLVTLQDKNYNNFIELMARVYGPGVRKEVVKSVVSSYSSVFDKSYTNSIGKINALLEVED